MGERARNLILTAAIALSLPPVLSADCPSPLIDKARRAFGEPLNAEHCVFALGPTNAVWFISDVNGNLVEVVAGPKSHYPSEFPTAKTPSTPEYLTDEEYADALRRISEVKDIGALKKQHGRTLWSNLGAFSTDRFEKAAVERIVGDVPADLQAELQHTKRFDLHFFEDIANSPIEVTADPDNPMVCLGDQWYYLPIAGTKKIRLGKWQPLRVAGPSFLTTACTRTTPLYDADGFTTEYPANELIVVDQPYKVQALAGRVYLGDGPLKGVNVEVKREGSRMVSRTKTGEGGTFKFSDASEGKYKFRVTKNGFKALTGVIIVDRHAAKGSLSFELPVGT